MIGAIDWASVVATCAALIVSIFGGLIELVLGALGGAAEGLAEGFASIGMNGVAGLFKGISDALLGIGTWLKTQLVDPIVNDIKEFLGIHSPSTVFAEIGMNLILGLLQGISETWGQIPTFFSTVLTALESTIGTAWTSIKETVSTAASNAYQAVSTAWTAVKTETSTAWTAAKQTVSDAWQKVKADTSTTVANVRSSVGQAWSNVKATTSTTFANVQTTATQKFNAMRASVVSTANNIRTSIASTWQSVQTTASSKWQSITSTVTSKWNALKSSLMAKSSEWTSIGTNLVQGLKSGIENAWHALTSKVQSLAQNLTNTMKNAVGVHSPSVIWAKIAYYLDQGLLKGLRAGEPSVLSGVDSLADKMTAGLDFSNVSFSLPSMSAISDMIASAGQLAIPDIAAGTVIPYKTKIDTSGAEIDASATLSDNFSGIDERLSDLNGLLQKVLTAIVEHGDVYIDIDALSKMVTRSQKNRILRYGGA